MSGVDDVEATQKKHKAPYTPHHPIPTVQKYREEKREREEQYGTTDGAEDDRSKLDRLGDAYTAIRHGREAVAPNENTQPYKAENKNYRPDEDPADDHAGRVESGKGKDDQEAEQEDENAAKDTTEDVLSEANPKKARKAMKKWSADGTEREVTDPVTHLPVTIHDFTDKDLKTTPKNGPPAGSEPKSATGAAAMNKSNEQLRVESEDAQDGHAAMEALFPPPDFSMTREGINDVYKKAVTTGLGIASSCLTVVIIIFQVTRHVAGWSGAFFTLLEVAVSLGVSTAVVLGMRQWTENKINDVWETEVWQAERQQGKKLAKSQTAESAQWLNSLLASIWPLINPDLFASIADTLEVGIKGSSAKER